MKFYIKIIIITISSSIFFGCNTKNDKMQKDKIIATVNNNNIFLSELDSIVANQIYSIRVDALELILSRNIIGYEAIKQGKTEKELIEKQINTKCREVTKKDIEEYILQNEILYVDTSSISLYLLNIYRKNRQTLYIDSLKKYYSVKIKLKPLFFKNINTSGIYSHNLTKNNSKTEVIIISDFKCPSCQKAEKALKELYSKYNNKVNFKFVFYSYYIDKSILACEAAAKQNKFKEMHDVIFKNADILEKDTVYYKFAKEIGLKMNLFNADMKDKNILSLLLDNKELIKSKEFILNSCVYCKR